jgi:hypothetical protein
MSLMPTAILADSCTICNNLLSVQVASTYATITATTEYVANSQYWFVITFNFGATAFIPDFQFIIQINPTYASYFSSADMAQKLTGIYSQTSTSAAPQAISNPRQNANIRFGSGNPNVAPSKLTVSTT